VALHTEAYYRAIVGDHLNQAGMTEPPISVDEVAARLGVPVRMVTFPTWFRGAIVSEDGMPVIIVNSAIPLEIRRNALAHMLSHILLRLSDPHAVYPRDTQEPHREADVMAAQFVLPDAMVIEQARKWFNDYRYLARLFGVSESDMMEKMRDLGLIKTRGVVWDY
jgi:hypothetical protein